MRIAWIWLLTVVLALLAAPQHVTAQAGPPRAVVVMQSAGFTHDVVKDASDGDPSVVQRVLAKLFEAQGIEATFTKDARELPAQLDGASLVVFYTTGDLPLSNDDLRAFNQWVRNGGAFLGMHCAADTFQNNPLYYELLGGTFDGHPWNAGDTVTLKVQDAEHPAAAPYTSGERQTFKEEIYQFKNFDPQAVRVLLSLDMQKTAKKAPRHVPIAWCKRVEQGRVFYTSLGHRQDVWMSEPYQAHLTAAIDWLLGRAEGNAEPNPAVHERETELAIRAASGGATPSTSSGSATPQAAANSVGLSAENTEGRPAGPRVFRSILDKQARMISVEMPGGLWLAYDATNFSLDQVWTGGVDFQGAVFDGRHGPQPVSKLDTLYFKATTDHPWSVVHGPNDEPVDIKVRYRGYRFVNGKLVLSASLILPDGNAIDVYESPEVAAGPTVVRGFKISNLPANHRLRLRVTGTSGTAPIGLQVEPPTVTKPARSGIDAVFAADGEATLRWSWSSGGAQ